MKIIKCHSKPCTNLIEIDEEIDEDDDLFEDMFLYEKCNDAEAEEELQERIEAVEARIQFFRDPCPGEELATYRHEGTNYEWLLTVFRGEDHEAYHFILQAEIAKRWREKQETVKK